jgi:hypothetical protein
MVQTGTIETRLAKLSFLDPGILCIRFKADVVLDLAGVNEVVEQRAKMANGKPIPVMVVLGADTFGDVRVNITDHAQRVKHLTLAEATVAPDEWIKRLADLYYDHHQPPFPTAIFATEAEAAEWLLAQM